MPVLRIQVTFDEVFVLDDADAWGTGEWFMSGRIDGQDVGNPRHEFTARQRQSFNLEPASNWTLEVDVSAKRAGDTVDILFQGIEHDPVGDNENLGEVRAQLSYPFRQEINHWYPSSLVEGKRYYNLRLVVRILDERATTSLTGFDDLRVSRAHSGATTFTATTSGTAVTPRVEICPVIPVPEPTRLPPRPTFPPRVASGRDTAEAPRVPPAAGLAFNALPNPSLIPVLNPTDAGFNDKVARIAVTYMEPRNLDLSYLVWRVASGPVAFSGETEGQTVVRAYGTSGTTDQMATIELRWRRADGPLLATYRAWVGPPKRIHYRANIISGDSRRSRVTNVTPANVAMHIACCKMYFWQAGIELVADDAANGVWDDAVAVTGQPGIFTIQLSGHNGWTRNLNIDVSPMSVTRLNFRPGVLNMIYVHSTNHRCAVATDRPRLHDLQTQSWASTRGTDDVITTLSGSPSSSWVCPSGLPGDTPAADVEMLLMFQSERGTSRSDRAYARTRTPNLTQNDWNRHYAFVVPSVWSTVLGSDPIFSYNVIHESGHVLGLRHRGNGGNPNPPLSNDEVNTPAANGLVRHGHPYLENIMTYNVQNAQDIDLIQTMVIRAHPLANVAP
jgi:hypothetical protein